jgi:hypothetical protein
MQIESKTFSGATIGVERPDEAEGRQLVKRLMTDTTLKEILLVSKRREETILHLVRQDTKQAWQFLSGRLG